MSILMKLLGSLSCGIAIVTYKHDVIFGSFMAAIGLFMIAIADVK